MKGGFTLRNGFGLGLLFLCLCIPFELRVLPSTGILLEQWTTPFLQTLGKWLTPTCLDCIWTPISDSHGLYLLALSCLLLGVGTAFLLAWRFRDWQRVHLKYIEIILLLYLSVHVGGYGVQKLLMQQFFPPEANTLYTALGQLEKDILFWSTMGVSRTYNFFLGSMEIIPALMLLHYRSRTIALVFLSMILLHVLIIDISYDIDVKFYAGFLLTMAIYLLWPLMVVIRRDSDGTAIVIHTRRLFPEKTSSSWLRPIVILIVLAEMLSPIAARLESSNSQFFSKNLVGAYEQVGGDHDSVQKVFFHSKGYLITMDDKGIFTDHRAMSTSDGRELILLDESRLLKLTRDSSSDALLLDGRIKNSPIHWRLHKLNLERLPLMKDRGEWLVTGD